MDNQDDYVAMNRFATENDPVIFTEPIFDKKIIFEYYGGSENPLAFEIFKDSAFKMLASLEERLSLLKTSLHQEDYKKIVFYAHLLKGSFNAMGSPRLSKYCETIEKCAAKNELSQKDLTTCHETFERILSLSLIYELELENFINPKTK